MRDDYQRFRELGAEIVVVSRHDAERMREHWRTNRLPYLGVADPGGEVSARYGQQWKLTQLGRMPAQFVVDCRATIAFAHYAGGMSDIPRNERMLELIRGIDGCPPPAEE